MRFYHLADVHLGAVPDRDRPWSAQRARDIFESFYQVLDQAREEGIDAIFICGDLFHRQPLKRELKELAYHFVKASGTQIFMIAGNHDPVTEGSPYKTFAWPENVTFLSGSQCRRIYVPSLNLCVYGLSYHSREITRPLYDDLDPRKFSKDSEGLPKDCCHILLAHGGDQKHIPIRWDRLRASGFDYIALGHIHKPWLDPAGKMAYCGALQPVNKNDEGPHGFIRGEVTGRQVKLSFVPWAKWNYVNLNINVCGDMTWSEVKDLTAQRMEDCSASLAPGKTNLYKIALEGFKSLDLAYDLKELFHMGNVVSVTDAMALDFDFDSLYEANKGNLLGRYMDKVKAMDLDEASRRKILYYGFCALYRTGGGMGQ